MSVNINRSVFIKNPDGSVLQITEKHQVSETTDISAICDGPRCASRRASRR
jgi:hypothetical protein